MRWGDGLRGIESRRVFFIGKHVWAVLARICWARSTARGKQKRVDTATEPLSKEEAEKILTRAIGVLKNRPATIPRGPEELNEILTGYLDDQKLTPSDKKKNKSAEEQRLSKRMYEASERMRPSAIPRARRAHRAI